MSTALALEIPCALNELVEVKLYLSVEN